MEIVIKFFVLAIIVVPTIAVVALFLIGAQPPIEYNY